MAAIDLRYARALAAVLADRNLNAAAAQGQLEDFAATLEASVQLREVLADPSIPEPQKLGVLDAIAAKAGMAPPVRNFLALLAHHGRMHELPAMAAAFAELTADNAHVVEASVVSAHPLDADSRALLERQIVALSAGLNESPGVTVRATYSEDPALLGGAVVRIGSTVYDGSVRAQLQQLKERLIAA